MSRFPISTNRPPKDKQLEPGALRGAGQGVEHDVDAIAVGVSADLLGELDASRIVDMLNSHVVQQRSPLRAAGGREDLGSRGAGDRDRRLSHAAGRGVDQHLVTGLDPGQIMQAVPGGGVRGGHRGGLAVGQAAAAIVAARRASQVTNVPQQPLGDTPPTWSPTW